MTLVSPVTAHPLSLEERRQRDFCICSSSGESSGTSADGTRCPHHPEGVDLPIEARAVAGFLFYDERRRRHVNWADIVEAMRQGHPAGKFNPGLVQHTWVALMRLLESLADPAAPPAAVVTQDSADALVAWADAHLTVDERRWLLGFARGGGVAALETIFRGIAARAAHEARTAHEVTT
jgi:hypothetical protein